MTKVVAPEITVETIRKDLIKETKDVLAMAKKILDDAAKYDVVRANALLSVGINTPKVTEAVRSVGKNDEQKRILHYAELVKENYPDHKFISSTAVQKILDKYDLVIGPIQAYDKKEIPRKNEDDILNFKRPNGGPLYNSTSYMIIGPAQDFNTARYSLQGRVVASRALDPIVLCPVPSGYIIITAWGPEAEIPEIK